MRLRLLRAGLAMISILVAATVVAPGPATADASTTAANCGGYTLISANYVRLTNGSNTAAGSIQLCQKYSPSSEREFFARIQMYAPVPSGYGATAIVYYQTSSGIGFGSCDKHQGHVRPGGTVCYSSDVLNNAYVWGIHAVGRMYRVDAAGNTVIHADGITATVN